MKHPVYFNYIETNRFKLYVVTYNLQKIKFLYNKTISMWYKTRSEIFTNNWKMFNQEVVIKKRFMYNRCFYNRIQSCYYIK